MSPDEWPIRIPQELGANAPVRETVRDRMSVVRQDLFLPRTHRLTEQEASLMTAMLHRLVEDVSVDIQAQLPQDWLPANEDHGGLIDRLWQSGLLDIDGLMALLLRQADEQRIAGALKARQVNRSASVVQPLVSGEDPEIAAAAMAVLIARGRRRDRFGQALIELDDLDRQSASVLVHTIAAGLCERKPVHISAREAEHRLCAAADALVAGHDFTKSLDALTAALVGGMDAAGLLDDQWIRSAIDVGDIGVLGHSLARCAGAPHSATAAELLSGDVRRTMLVLRVAGMGRELAGHLLAVLGDLLGVSADARALTLFDSISMDRITAAKSWLTLDPHFKIALKGLGHGHRDSGL